MTRTLTQFGQQLAGWIRRAVALALVAAAATPALAQSGNDFGPSPDSFFGQDLPSYDRPSYDRWNMPAQPMNRGFDSFTPSRRFSNDRQFDNRPLDDGYGAPNRNGFDPLQDRFGPVGNDRFDRNFSNGNSWNGPTSGRHRNSSSGWDQGGFPGRGSNFGQDRWNLSRRLPQDQPGSFDSFPTTRQRIPYDQGSQYDRMPQYGPTAPVTPAAPASTLHPTIEQKISARYEDPRVLRMLSSLTQQSGEASYLEIAQLIDSRHIEPTSYAQRTQAALQHLSIAAGTPSFQRAMGLQAGSPNIRQFQLTMQQMQSQANVQSANDAIQVMRQAGSAANQILGINPAVVDLEFVYAALDTLDQYSMLAPPEKSGAPSMGLENNIVGIGVELEANPRGLAILKVLDGGPASQATLRRGDIITAVNGRSVAGIDLNQAVDQITGPQGTTVQLTIRRDDLVGDTTLTRQQVTIHNVADVRMEDPVNKIGYIKVEKFAESTAQELDAALWQLQQQGMQSLILDLRGNPGGLLTTCVAMSDKFLPQGTIVSTRGRNPQDNSQEVAHKQNTWKVPLVVLVDHNSASASEIFAAAIQDNGRGVVIGEKSYGKGTVQTLFPIQSIGAGLRLTTARFYSPRGVAMAGVGVTPDVQVQPLRNDTSNTDRVLQTAVQVARDPRTKDMANNVARTGAIGTGSQG